MFYLNKVYSHLYLRVSVLDCTVLGLTENCGKKKEKKAET